jgi:glutamate synthase (NADPH/NADH) large chain
VARLHAETQDHGLVKALDNELIAQAAPALERGEVTKISLAVKNINRTVGAMLSGEVARRYGHAGLPDDTLQVALNGTAGQSFAAFLARGVTITLTGEGNDYVGKGLSGGRIVIRPNAAFTGKTWENIIVGNTVLFGAIAGEAFFAGVGGERFAVRNSGATAVVEGLGDHGCEYMTGGTVAVLGATGRNFAAGMSGGIAYVYDPDGVFAGRCNMAQVALEQVVAAEAQEQPFHNGVADEVQLKALITKHADLTGSQRAAEILANWPASRAAFVKVFPNEYRRALKEMAAAKEVVAQKEIA